MMAVLFTNGNSAIVRGGRTIKELSDPGWFEVYLNHLEQSGVDPTMVLFKTAGGNIQVFKKEKGGFRWTILPGPC